jgi:putative FmdB family regulatory protein
LPLYEYECLENGHRFELIRKYSDPELKVCTKCRSKVRRLLSAPAISFKGTGWYITDYKKGGSDGNGSKRDAKPDEKPEGKPSSDSKPDSKSGAKKKPSGGSGEKS